MRPRALLVVALMLIPLIACSGPSNGQTTPTTSGGQPGTTTPSATTPSVTTPEATATSTSTPSATASPVPTEAGTPSSSPTASTTSFNLYFMRGDKIGVAHRTMSKTQQVGAAAMKELLSGPNPKEQAAGLTSAIPAGTKFLGLTINNGLASVNLSGEYEAGGGSLSMASRLAEVVYTLTQFSSVRQVTFQLDGKPVTVFGGEGIVMDHPVDRSNYEQLTPAILVESVAPGDTVTSPAHLTGTANTFEAAFTINILDANGNLLVEQHATATSGTGTRGTFDVTVPFKVDKEQNGKVVVFELSAKDGSKTNVVEIPVTLKP